MVIGARGIIVLRALTVAFAAASFALLPALPALAGGSAHWPPQGGSSWAGQANSSELPGPADMPEVQDFPIRRPAAGEFAAEQAAVPIVFPVAGPADYSDSFGAPRPDGRTHEGIDIFADKMTPVVAVADGTVSLVRDGADCCALRIRHDDGRSSLYLHLNNDTPGTDDGQGYGIADGIGVGTRVAAGTVVGYVGDSGNAEDVAPHLHFEMNDASGALLNPYGYLRVAQGADPILLAASFFAPPETLPVTGTRSFALLGWSLVLLLLGAGLLRAGRSHPTVLRKRGRVSLRRAISVNPASSNIDATPIQA